MQFNKNKKEPFHRWYPFVEGYSKEFIQSIVKEMDRNNLVNHFLGVAQLLWNCKIVESLALLLK